MANIFKKLTKSLARRFSSSPRAAPTNKNAFCRRTSAVWAQEEPYEVLDIEAQTKEYYEKLRRKTM